MKRHKIDLRMLIQHIMKSDLLGREKLYLEKLLNRNRWIPCSERMPEAGKIVLVYQNYERPYVTIGRLKPVEKGFMSYWEFQEYREDFRHTAIFDNGVICPGSQYVTHWMPLPEPPEREDNNG